MTPPGLSDFRQQVEQLILDLAQHDQAISQALEDQRQLESELSGVRQIREQLQTSVSDCPSEDCRQELQPQLDEANRKLASLSDDIRKARHCEQEARKNLRHTLSRSEGLWKSIRESLDAANRQVRHINGSLDQIQAHRLKELSYRGGETAQIAARELQGLLTRFHNEVGQLRHVADADTPEQGGGVEVLMGLLGALAGALSGGGGGAIIGGLAGWTLGKATSSSSTSAQSARVLRGDIPPAAKLSLAWAMKADEARRKSKTSRGSYRSTLATTDGKWRLEPGLGNVSGSGFSGSGFSGSGFSGSGLTGSGFSGSGFSGGGFLEGGLLGSGLSGRGLLGSSRLSDPFNPVSKTPDPLFGSKSTPPWLQRGSNIESPQPLFPAWVESSSIKAIRGPQPCTFGQQLAPAVGHTPSSFGTTMPPILGSGSSPLIAPVPYGSF